jgi:beta-xylosidase
MRIPLTAGGWNLPEACNWVAVLVGLMALAIPRGPELHAQHLEVRAHDPMMIRAGDRFYLFSTGRGVSVWSSRDMKTWEPLAPVHASAPAWTERVVPGFGTRNHMWAPDVLHRNEPITCITRSRHLAATHRRSASQPTRR